MTSDNSSTNADQAASGGLAAPMARRRLIRSALGTPVVLSSLVSKPVLGGQHVGCTPSGVGSLAPGARSHSPEVEVCNTAGNSARYWMDAKEWPSPIVKGQGKAGVGGTSFNGFSGLTNCFYINSGGGGMRRAATMLEVLNGSIAGSTNGTLGRAAVVSLLNAYDRPLYPVKPDTIVKMFNAAYTGNNYAIGGAGSPLWTPQQVLSYLESLYPQSLF